MERYFISRGTRDSQDAEPGAGKGADAEVVRQPLTVAEDDRKDAEPGVVKETAARADSQDGEGAARATSQDAETVRQPQTVAGAGRQDAEPGAEKGADRADSQDAELGAEPVNQPARQSHTKTWAVVRYVDLPARNNFRPVLTV